MPEDKDRITCEEYDHIIETEIEENLPKAIHYLTHMQLAQRCARAHLRLLLGPSEEGKIEWSDGDESESGRPFLSEEVRRTIQPVD